MNRFSCACRGVALGALLGLIPACDGGGGGGGAAPQINANVLLTGNQLAAFSTDNPAGIETPVAVIGLTVGDTLVAIDRRPQNGFLYGLGFNSGAGTAQLYSVSSVTGQATL